MERPKPLDLSIYNSSTPKEIFKSMLENSVIPENSPSPLTNLDPLTLDELITRIDTESLALNQVPNPQDIDQLVNLYWSMRDKFNLEYQNAMSEKSQRKPREAPQSINTTSIFNLLKS